MEAKTASEQERMTSSTDGVVVMASRRKAALLMMFSAFVVLTFIGVDWFRGYASSVKWAAIIFGMFFALYFMTFALALFFRRKPVFSVNAEGIGMPVGGLSLLEVPWHDVDGYAIVTKRIKWIPGLASRAFGVRLTHDAHKRGRFSESALREFRLNRASMDVDVLLTHWFSPVAFEEIREAARRFRPALDQTPEAELRG
ncbi:MAG: hypothetical protein AAFT19_00220 [Pseudomonadota bacterium]